jgi:hypothetical protein
VGGERSVAYGEYSFAFGFGAEAKGKSSFSLGYKSNSTGMYSVALGRESQAIGNGAMALGYKIISLADNSFLFGKYLKSTGGGSVVLGMGAGATEDKYLKCTKAYSLVAGFNSDVPTFVISSSSGIGTTGRIGIGNITSPEAKLHIKADDDEDAAIKLEPTDIDYFGKILFGDDSHLIYGKTDKPLTFKSDNTNGFFFENGKVGIGTDSPDYLLDVAGNLRFTGKLFLEIAGRLPL